MNLTIDHQKNAASVNLTLRPTTVLVFTKELSFREQLILKILFSRTPTIAIDLPEKVLIYQDAKGKVRVKVNTPGYLIDRHIDESVGKQYGKGAGLCGIGCVLGLENIDGLIETNSVNSVDRTIEKLRNAVVAAGFLVPGVFDYGMFGRESKVLVFGNPKVGTQLMQNSQEFGIDLPQKFLVYKTKSGVVKIVHNDPRFLARRAGVQGLDMLLGNVAMALQNFANMGAK